MQHSCACAGIGNATLKISTPFFVSIQKPSQGTALKGLLDQRGHIYLEILRLRSAELLYPFSSYRILSQLAPTRQSQYPRKGSFAAILYSSIKDHVASLHIE